MTPWVGNRIPLASLMMLLPHLEQLRLEVDRPDHSNYMLLSFVRFFNAWGNPNGQAHCTMYNPKLRSITLNLSYPYVQTIDRTLLRFTMHTLFSFPSVREIYLRGIEEQDFVYPQMENFPGPSVLSIEHYSNTLDL